MSTRRASLLVLLSLGSLLLGQWDAAAADKSSSVDKNPKTGSLSAVLGVPNMPSLSGLIRPEKMGLLTDNKLTAKDNEAHLLSDNETDVDILSHNVVEILSGIEVFSGLTVNVRISVHRDHKKANKGKGRRKGKSRKAKRR
jgi:hypothetical protein